MNWLAMIPEDDVASWQTREKADEEAHLEDRCRVQLKVCMWTEKQMLVEAGEMHDPWPDRKDPEELRRVPIERVTERKLRRSGRNMVASCPFHDDANPSCIVYPEGRGFWCPACGKGGNTVDWVMGEYGCTFAQAAEIISRCL